jgi:acetyl-CoA C-acetyltransferase
MESIKDKVAIIGMGCIKFGELWNKSAEDMIVEAVKEAYEDAGVGPDQIQAGWFASMLTGETGQVLCHALKLNYNVPITRVENACATGSDALRNAIYGVASGAYDVALVCGVEKIKDSGWAGLEPKTLFPDPCAVRPQIAPPSQFAFFATKYFEHYGISYEEGRKLLSQISVKNHHNGSLNPKAMFQREITLADAMNSPLVSWPLNLYDCCGNSDGAAAAIITRADLAKNFKKDYVLIKGIGLSVGAGQGLIDPDFDFLSFPETRNAARAAYADAGIKIPRKEVDLAIVHDCFTITELITMEDLGFSEKGKAKYDVEAGTFALSGELPVNTDGGLKSFGHPIGASGLRMVYEVYKQLQGKAGKRQLKKADIGVTHNLGGLSGSYSCAVCVLGRK